MNLIDIKSPADLKGLSIAELTDLYISCLALMMKHRISLYVSSVFIVDSWFLSLVIKDIITPFV